MQTETMYNHLSITKYQQQIDLFLCNLCVENILPQRSQMVQSFVWTVDKVDLINFLIVLCQIMILR